MLLRRLRDRLLEVPVRAFADDTAVVTPDLESHAPMIMQIPREFAQMSNLSVNFKKTVSVPLWEVPAAEVKNQLASHMADWTDVEATGSAKASGYQVGPDRGKQSWEEACRKLTTRVESGVSFGPRMRLSSIVYRLFCLSPFSFLGQLEDPPQRCLH